MNEIRPDPDALLRAAAREGVARAVAPALSSRGAPSAAAQPSSRVPFDARSLDVSRNPPAVRPHGRAARW